MNTKILGLLILFTIGIVLSGCTQTQNDASLTGEALKTGGTSGGSVAPSKPPVPSTGDTNPKPDVTDFCEVSPIQAATTFSAPLNSSTGSVEFVSEQELPVPAPQLDCFYYQKKGQTKQYIAPLQTIGVKADVAMDISNFQEKDLAARIGTNDYNYTVNFNTGIPTDINFAKGDKAFIPFIGGRYKVLELNESTQMIRLQNDRNSSDVFEVKAGCFPAYYSPPCLWSSALTFTGSGSQRVLKGITFRNEAVNWINDPLYSDESLYPTLHPPFLATLNAYGPKEGLSKVQFEGFNTNTLKSLEFLRGSSASGISALHFGAINYSDWLGFSHSIPMAIYLPTTTSQNQGGVFQFDGVNHVYSTNSAINPTTFRLKNNSSDVQFSSGYDYQVEMMREDHNYGSWAVVKLSGQGHNTGFYKYLVRRAQSTQGVWLVLAGYSNNGEEQFDGFIDWIQENHGKLFFQGTAINDLNVVMEREYYSTTHSGLSAKFTRPFYYPDLSDFNGSDTGSSTGIYRTAIFRIRESQGQNYDDFPINFDRNTAYIYIDTEAGNSGTVDTANVNKPNYSGKSTAMEFYADNQNLTRLAEYNDEPGQPSANFSRAYSDVGSWFKLNDRNLEVGLVRIPAKVHLSIEFNE